MKYYGQIKYEENRMKYSVNTKTISGQGLQNAKYTKLCNIKIISQCIMHCTVFKHQVIAHY